jgi:hypothetical protein
MGQNKAIGCSFSRIGSYGRLGNQLFQYCLSKAVSLKLNCDLYLHDNHDLKTYFNPEKIKYKSLKDSNLDFKTFSEKKDFVYDSSVFSIKEPTDFFGYFQHIDYFKDFIFEIFYTIEPQSQAFKEALSFIRTYSNDFDNCCSVHIRRGDYLEVRNKNVFQYLDKNYYQTILHNIPKNTTVFILSDDIDYVKDEFQDFDHYNTIIFVDHKNPIINFYIMYICRINIIANSTFSYWASLLSDKNNQKSVYYPDIWMINDPQPKIFKDNWTIFSNKWLNLFSTK